MEEDHPELLACLNFIEKFLSTTATDSSKSEERNQLLMDLFRSCGAPMTRVKEIKKKIRNLSNLIKLEETTTDIAEVIGLLMFELREEPCIPSSCNSVREGLLKIADAAFKVVDDKSVSGTPSQVLTEKKSRAISSSYKSGEEDDIVLDEEEDDDDDDFLLKIFLELFLCAVSSSKKQRYHLSI